MASKKDKKIDLLSSLQKKNPKEEEKEVNY